MRRLSGRYAQSVIQLLLLATVRACFRSDPFHSLRGGRRGLHGLSFFHSMNAAGQERDSKARYACAPSARVHACTCTC